MKNFFGNNINGFLGTLAFHLVILVIFLLFKISYGSVHHELIELSFEQENPQDALKKLEKEQKDKIDQLKKVDLITDGLIRRNIGVNVSDKTEDEINTNKFIREYTDENKLEGFKKILNPEPPANKSVDTKENAIIEQKLSVDEKPAGSKQLYKGPTNIYYDLKDRKGTYVPVPVYKCEGSGKTVVEIIVNQSGVVVSTSILKTESGTDDECLYSAAIYYASITRFNSDLKAPPKQKGTITYVFVPQH